MLSYCAVYVDAGYLYAASAARVTGTSLRSGVAVDHENLVAEIIGRAEGDSRLQLLRVNWYDSGNRPGGEPDYHQEVIGLLPRVKLRLGRRSYTGEQKGVDLKIGLDLVSHARTQSVDVMYLLSGDDDLTEAVEDAQHQGCQVILMTVPDVNGNPKSVSRHLQRAADRVVVLDPNVLDRAVIPVDKAEPEAPRHRTPATAPAYVPEAPSAGVPEQPVPVPSPALLDRARQAARHPTTRRAAPTPVYSTRTGDAPAVERADVPEYDVADDVGTAIDAVCESVLSSWMRSADEEDLRNLRLAEPSIPADIDRTLLVDLSDRLDIYDLGEDIRFELRARFWKSLRSQS